MPRKVQIAVVSDVHLGTFGAKAGKLFEYLDSIRPEILVLNGDFIDFWQLSSYYWPESHRKVMEKLRDYLNEGVQVYYITGNHDEVLRRYTLSGLCRFQLLDELDLDVDGKKAWFIHGDVYDPSMKSRFLTRLGAFFYGAVVLLNKAVNFLWRPLTGRELRFSKVLKAWVKQSVRKVEDFREKAIDAALARGCGYLVCGHNHSPEITPVQKGSGSLIYLNSGDWIENLSALEYDQGNWALYFHPGNGVKP